MKYILLYLTLINAYAFFLMLIDKQKARKHRRRIPERTLITAALLGGSVGGIAGMYLFRHKTRHLKFILGLPAILAIQIIGTILLWVYFFS